MVENISTTLQKAKKDYRDDSAEFIIECLPYMREGRYKLSFSEWRSIARLKANNWKILKGQLYERQFNKMDGDSYTFRTLPDIGKLCSKHDIYPEI